MYLQPGSHVHLIAACGTAMGSLAGMLRERGYRVTGSDTHVYPPMSTFLRELGVEVGEGFDPARLIPAPDLVVVGNAVSRGNPEVEETLSRRLRYASLPEVLRELFLRGRRPVVVTGTHGKTTTTAMTAHLLVQGNLDPSFLVAGIPKDFSHPYRLGSGDLFVVEGDEYDSAFFAKHAKFFYYLPQILIVNNLEFDHADIYADLGEIEKAFRQLINIVPANGLLLAHHGDPVVAALLPGSFAPVETFGLEAGACWLAEAVTTTATGIAFRLRHHGDLVGDFHLPLHGEYNVRNALAALAVGFHAGLEPDRLRRALGSFSGVKRRQEVVGQVAGITLIDDFAHHPTAVEATLKGVRQTRPDGRLWAVFEPASATNARALFEERYARAFAAVDRFIIARVPRPERARGDAPFSPERLAEAVRRLGGRAEFFPEVEEIIAAVAAEARPGDTVVFMSNGGFGGIQGRLLAALRQRHGSEAA
ncbi:MAG: UDP-N-acetylmuramate:L-alanyl-gamma-D-glutamyl-meso-diaminopimelate ligase [Candidatus Latescibacterota bacterium]|jgi:UDP-N-acetylmuramate: L-alanyl-gamma-D-glutamyl-meso-diaminopimelate ligase